MSCKYVLRRLSEFFDETLGPDSAIKVSQHLSQCASCRKELESLSALRQKLRSLGNIQAPEYLRHMIQLRLAEERRYTWHARLRYALEYRWSKIRTLEGMWYLTRLLGTAMTSVLFFLASIAISPIYFAGNSTAADSGSVSPVYCQQLAAGVLQRLGLSPEEDPQKRITRSKPAINDEYFLKFGQNASETGGDDTFSVVTVVDRSGAVKIQNVLEYPADQSLLSSFNNMMASARCRPASKNGRAVTSHIVLTYSQISVSSHISDSN
jgi:hypothetical protein